MNAKHYVSLEVAKILKEKGYNEETEYAIDKNSEIYQERRTNQYLSWAWQCPSLLEAMDWLEKRGVRIEILWSDDYSIWYPIIRFDGEIFNIGYYTDRNECMNEAIKTGVELL